MSYAIETKKRKFDRILEAITDGASSPASSPGRSTLYSRKEPSTTSLSQDAASESSKRRRVANATKTTMIASPTPTDLSSHYLPSSRPVFLQRLETFRHVTQWHVPSTDRINAAAWAKRGWVCVDNDTVSCGACQERIHVNLEVDDKRIKSNNEEDDKDEVETSSADQEQEDDFAMSTEIYDNIVRRYEGIIVTAHSESCLWRKRGCDSSIQRIEGLLNTNQALSSLRKRYESLIYRPEEMPHVEELPASAYVDLRELDQFRSNTEGKPDINALRLVVCGWERRSEDVIECRHCYRSLGLWLYRGDSPAIEKLDAIESHLEYCPWRSAAAQETEVQEPHDKKDGSHVSKKERVPGWILVYQAIAKNNKQRSAPRPQSAAAPSEIGSSTDSNLSVTSEQKRKELKDLLRRGKDLRKIFNVKALLRKKDKT